jgi:hypothetical protein
MADTKEITPDIQESIEESGQPNTETTPEVTPEEVTPEEAVPPAKHKYADRLSQAFPEREFKTDEEHDAGMDELLTDLTGYKDKGQSTNKKLIAMFEAEPQVGEIVRDCINGATFREALARHVSPDDITAVEGDPDFEGWSKNKTAREEGQASKQKFADDYAKNISTSEQAVTAYVEKQGLSPEDADAFFGKFDEMLDNVSKGIITEANLDAWMKALNYDSDVIAATEEGKIAGRNENIVAKKEAPAVAGDGLPRPTRTSQEEDQAAPAPNYMESLVNKTKKRDQFA